MQRSLSPDRQASVTDRCVAANRFVVFQSQEKLSPTSLALAGQDNIYMRDLKTGRVRAITERGLSGEASISGDGRMIAFRTAATLTGTQTPNPKDFIYVADLQAGYYRPVGAYPPCFNPIISKDGTTVAFACWPPTIYTTTNTFSQIVVSRMNLLQGGFASSNVSLNSSNVPGNANSSDPAISADGKIIAYLSSATNLVTPSPPAGIRQVFRAVRATIDRIAPTTILASVNTAGQAGDGASYPPSISDDGQKILFASQATNLAPGVPAGTTQVYLRDVTARTTVLVSCDASGAPWPVSCDTTCSLSPDGKRASFTAVSGAVKTVYVKDLITGAVTPASGSAPNGDCDCPALGDTFLVFRSRATNLARLDTTNDDDICLAQPGRPGVGLISGASQPRMARLSLSNQGQQVNASFSAPAISGDGRVVAFVATAPLLPGDTNGRDDLYVFDRYLGRYSLATVSTAGAQGTGGTVGSPMLSEDGRLVTFSSSHAGLAPGVATGIQVYVHDNWTGETRRLSASSGVPGNGASTNPWISADGHFVAFQSDANNLVPGDGNGRTDVFVANVDNGLVERASLGVGNLEGNSASALPSISGDGRFVAFESTATNLLSETVARQAIYVRDRVNGSTALVRAPGGAQPNGHSRRSSISAQGRYVAFVSSSTNLVSGDTNGQPDVFVADLQTGAVTRESVSTAGVQANLDGSSASRPSISADGGIIAFQSRANNLLDVGVGAIVDTNGKEDVYLRDRSWSQTIRLGATATDRYAYFSDTWGGQNVPVPDSVVPVRMGDPNNSSSDPVVSGDGLSVIFCSLASNLVTDDTNVFQDIFFYSR